VLEDVQAAGISRQ
ncbi:Late transcription factor VLTF-4 (1), partial [Monkeypox virus]